MKKKILILCCILFTTVFTAQAQVTIGTNEAPQKYSVLEVVSTANNTGGLRLPHLSDADKSAIDSDILANPDKSQGLLIYSTTNSRVEFWDGTEWVAAQGLPEPWLVSGSTTGATLNNQKIYQKGSVTIGSEAVPDNSVILNVEAPDKGVLLPRVTLKMPTDATTILNPATGLLVYNTGLDLNFPVEGYMFWNGFEWRSITTGTSAPGSASLNCSMGGLDPVTKLTAGVNIPLGTLIKIPYLMGNGGAYKSATIPSSNPDIKAIINEGTLVQGSGTLVFDIIATGPVRMEDQAPNGLTFDLQPFYDANPNITGCSSITVGHEVKAEISSNAVMAYMSFTTDPNGTKGFSVQGSTPDGKYSVRAFLLHSNPTAGTATNNTRAVQYTDIQIKNNQPENVTIMWNMLGSYGGFIGGAGNSMTAPPNQWGGNNADSGNSWYQQTTASGRVNWSNEGIYQGTSSGPEFRYYSWIDTSTSSTTAYILSVMAGNPGGQSTTDPSKMKVYLKIDQITAP